ncbi:MAG: tetratricopeptide repeat protein [Bacteroidetes Order II. Incertae sedis bacterium]|nr:tetratricopeptide repeat protein [Bacteroidetes Order II. bacterium]
MATKTITKEELNEDVVVNAASHLEGFYRKYQKPLIIGLTAVVLLVAAYFLWGWYKDSQNTVAAQKIGFAVQQFELGEFNKALNGLGSNPGLLKIASEYGSTETGNLAHYYAAVAYDNLNNRKKALEHYESFDKGKNLIGASAYAGEAAIHEDTHKNYAKAAELYQKAASTYPDESSAPDYLRKAARNYEKAKDFKAAKAAYEQIKEKYPQSSVVSELDYYLGRIEALAR